MRAASVSEVSSRLPLEQPGDERRDHRIGTDGCALKWATISPKAVRPDCLVVSLHPFCQHRQKRSEAISFSGLTSCKFGTPSSVPGSRGRIAPASFLRLSGAASFALSGKRRRALQIPRGGGSGAAVQHSPVLMSAPGDGPEDLRRQADQEAQPASRKARRAMAQRFRAPRICGDRPPA
jgi:hypothetical protein